MMDMQAKNIRASSPTRGHKPWAVALDPALRQVYVLSGGDGGSISVMDMDDGTVFGTSNQLVNAPSLGHSRVAGIAIDDSKAIAYVVSNYDGILTRINIYR